MGKVKQIDLEEEMDPWLRQPKEPDTAFAYFNEYRQMSTQGRSLHALSQKVKRSKQRLATLSRKWRWPERAKAWDARVEWERFQGELEAHKEMAKRHVAFGSLMQTLGAKVLRNILDRIAKGEGVKISATEARKLLESGVSMERLAVGKPTEITAEVDGEEDVSVADLVEAARDYMNGEQG